MIQLGFQFKELDEPVYHTHKLRIPLSDIIIGNNPDADAPLNHWNLRIVSLEPRNNLSIMQSYYRMWKEYKDL